ncbi:MAG: hypothetical protein QXL47_01540 [Candidatus Anstonellales archaeon]
MKKLLSLFLFLLLVFGAKPPPEPNEAPQKIMNALCGFYIYLESLLPVIIIILIIFAAVIFAAGQVLGAETRSRANVWATAMLIGALIAILVALIGPWVMQELGFPIPCK